MRVIRFQSRWGRTWSIDAHMGITRGNSSAEAEKAAAIDYETKGNSVFEWLFSADDLVESAEILRKESYAWSGNSHGFPTFRSIRITDVVSMLYAMGIECLLKAIWLTAGEKLVVGGQFKKVPDVNNHDLSALARKVEAKRHIGLDMRDYDVLTSLTKAITSGRYPVERKLKAQLKNGFAPEYVFDAYEEGILQKKDIRSFEDIKQVLKKLYELLDPIADKEAPGYLEKTKRWVSQ